MGDAAAQEGLRFASCRADPLSPRPVRLTAAWMLGWQSCAAWLHRRRRPTTPLCWQPSSRSGASRCEEGRNRRDADGCCVVASQLAQLDCAMSSCQPACIATASHARGHFLTQPASQLRTHAGLPRATNLRPSSAPPAPTPLPAFPAVRRAGGHEHGCSDARPAGGSGLHGPAGGCCAGVASWQRDQLTSGRHVRVQGSMRVGTPCQHTPGGRCSRWPGPSCLRALSLSEERKDVEAHAGALACLASPPNRCCLLGVHRHAVLPNPRRRRR